MNNFFNLKRFGLLFKKHCAEHYKTYLMASAVLLGVFLLGGCFIVYLIEVPLETRLQSVLFVPIYFLAGAIFTSIIFTDISDKKKAISALTLPASHFEKFLVGWLFSYAIFSLVFLGSFYLILSLLLNLRHFPVTHISMFNVFSGPATLIFILYTFLHSITLYGAVLFERLHFIKTAFTFFVAVVVLTGLNTLFLEKLTGREVRPTTPFANLAIVDHNSYVAVRSIRVSEPIVGYMIIAAAIIFWVAAYYRLKEKQV
ncbi:hypothetical protein [Mucilaginibacter sp. L3T2-6]|uniref:hypothetical protein n=1 Tax=Mucilaginibacter sp. L3T2-6 TaxID=3062491 RepID=UPI0026757A72|nr:hypothetical protein [Mucilaginibacter sp. L3T2-6]MDO3645183.1 hypothetical protein [Mucilaginibacter sp. L3T2-6]MDV6217617.1 hypothetical protein [Mucilaginibacter sp. L3T2-6]